MENISFEQYSKIEYRVGRIIHAEPVPKSKKLLKLDVFFGDEDRVIITNIGEQFSCYQLTGIRTIFVTNFEPVVIMGIKSEGMLFAGTKPDGKIFLMTLDNDIEEGSKVG